MSETKYITPFSPDEGITQSGLVVNIGQGAKTYATRAICPRSSKKTAPKPARFFLSQTPAICRQTNAPGKAAGYRGELVYLSMPTEEVSALRVANRVAEGGHDVPLADLRRRFPRSRHHFENDYRPLADAWWEIDALSLAVIDSHDGSDSLPDRTTR